MIEYLVFSIGIGLAVSLLFSELFGLAAGGMVVPGYIALYLNQPLQVVLTLAAGLATYLLVHALSVVVILYGRRRTVLMILVGYLLGIFIGTLSFRPPTGMEGLGVIELSVIGYIIPGLIAIWIDRQGLIETMSTLLIASVVVRLILILIYGSEFQA